MTLRRRLTRAMQHAGKVTVNKIVVASLRFGVPLPSVSPRTVIALETFGRRSGGRRLTPMGYVRIDANRLWVVSEHGRRSDWYRNARWAGVVQVLVERSWHPATVELLPEEDPAAVLRRYPSRMVALANRALWYRPEVVELQLDGS